MFKNKRIIMTWTLLALSSCKALDTTPHVPTSALDGAMMKVSGTVVAAGSSIQIIIIPKTKNGLPVVPGTTLTTNGVSVPDSSTSGSSGDSSEAAPTEASNIKITLSGGSSFGTISNVVDNKDGTYSAIFTGVKVGTPVKISALINGKEANGSIPITVVAGPASGAASVVSVPANLASGGMAQATIVVKDAWGNPVTSGGANINLSSGGGSSSVNWGPVIDNGDGTYSVSMTGVVAGTPSQVRGTVNGIAFSSDSAPWFQVIGGTPSPSTSQVTILPSTLVAGTSAVVTITAKDANGNILTSGGLNVGINLIGDPSAGTISSIVDNHDGTYTAILTVNQSGTFGISATINGTPVASSSGAGGTSVSVSPAVPDLSRTQFSIANSTLTSGSSSQLSIVVYDSYGNRINVGGLAFSFGFVGSSLGNVTNFVDNGNGTYSATFNAVAAGSSLLQASTVAGSLSTKIPLTVNAAEMNLTQSTVTAAAGSMSAGGSTVVTLTAKDSQGNRISNLSGVSFSLASFTAGSGANSGASSGSFGAVSNNGDGTYSASFSGNQVGTAVVKAAVAGVGTTSSSASISVVSGSISYSQSTLVASPTSLQSGASGTVTLTAKDAYGNRINSGGLSVVFSAPSSAGSSSVSFSPSSGAATDGGNGIYTGSFSGNAAGTAVQIKAAVGSNFFTNTASVTVSPGAMSLSNSSFSPSAGTMSAGGSVTFTFTAKDAQGNLIKNLTGLSFSSTFTAASGSNVSADSGTFGTVVNNGDGTYSVTFTASQAGSAVIQASVSGLGSLAGTQTVTVSPGAISYANSTVSVSPASLQSGASGTVTLTAKDAYGNRINSGGLSVVFSAPSSAGSSSVSFSPSSGAATDGGSGIYTGSFSGNAAGTAVQIKAAIGSNFFANTASVTVSAGAFSLSQSSLSVSPSSLSAGGSSTVTVTAKDAQGNLITNLSGLTLAVGSFTAASGASSTASTGSFGTVVNNGNGTYSFLFTAAKAGTAVIQASVAGVGTASSSPSITIQPGAISYANSTLTAASSSPAVGVSDALTLVAKDAYGNNLSSGGLSIVFSAVVSTGSSTVTFTPSNGAATDNGNGTYSGSFALASAGTSIQIRAAAGSTYFSSSPTISAGGGLNLEVPIEMADTGLSANVPFTFEVSRTNLNTNDYDGSLVKYYFEVVVSSLASVSETISIVDSIGNVLGSINAYPSVYPVRYRIPFTPNSGLDNYRVKSQIGSSNWVTVTAARILVQQANATKTRIYIPLVSDDFTYVAGYGAYGIDSSTSTSDTQADPGNYHVWRKHNSDFATISSGTPWQFDALLWSSVKNGATGTCYASLFNRGKNHRVSISQLSTTSSNPSLLSASFADNSTDFDDLNDFEVKVRTSNSNYACNIAKAGLWVSLDHLTKGEVYYRVDRQYKNLSLTNYDPSFNGYFSGSLAVIDKTLFNPGHLYVYYELTGWTSSGASYTLKMNKKHNSDSGSTDNFVPVASCASSSALTTTKGRWRSIACTDIDDGDRYSNQLSITAGSVTSTGHIVVVSFQP